MPLCQKFFILFYFFKQNTAFFNFNITESFSLTSITLHVQKVPHKSGIYIASTVLHYMLYYISNINLKEGSTMKQPLK